MTVQALPRGSNPFDTSGTHRRADGVCVYDALPETLVRELLEVVARTPEVEAVVEIGGDRLTYARLLDRASRVAGGLVAGGLAPGDRVALRLPAGTDWVVAFWGVLLARGVVVAVNTRFAAPEIEFVLTDSGASVQLLPGVALPDGEPHIDSGAHAQEIAAIFYTSGTTGRPKGVPTTHLAFLSNSETMVRCMGIDPGIGAGCRTLISVPLFHVTGCNAQLLTALHVGGTSVVLPALDLGVMMASIVDERISFLVTVPAIYNLMLRQPSFEDLDVSGVHVVGYGGAPIASSLVRSLQAAFPSARVFNGFGATETCSIVSVLPDTEAAEHADSIGYPAPVVDIAIDPAGRSSGDRGELLVRGPNVLQHYWGGRAPATTADGWFRTGDIVTVDDAGRIAIVDRAKDMINRGGENVASIEVEDALSDAPGVIEAAVVGVPDEVMGEKVGVVLVGDADLDVAEVLKHVAGRVADYKVPQYVRISDAPLPRNAAGKLLKAQIRDDAVWGDAVR